MNAAYPLSPSQLPGHQYDALQDACLRIAPTWPLDQLIAVNPWWELRTQRFSAVSAQLATLSQTHCLMPKAYYRDRWGKSIAPGHLEGAADELGVSDGIEALLGHLGLPDRQDHWYNIADWLDSYGDRRHRMAWQEEITHHISQFCAEFFQAESPMGEDQRTGFYGQWLALIRRDRGLEILMAEPGLRAEFGALPEDVESLLAEAFQELPPAHEHLADYLHALLLDVNGWASWIAYLRWQSNLQGGADHTLMHELLGVRIAWELVLWRHYQRRHPTAFQSLQGDWQRQWPRLSQIVEEHYQSQRLTWVWQRAHELSYQSRLHGALKQVANPSQSDAPALQAVFCIDVRSEPMRRALEAQHPAIETRGFAGFFGLPIQYQPQGTGLKRPQLPGLLKPAIEVTEALAPSSSCIRSRQRALQKTARLQGLQESTPAAYSLVEAAGLAYIYKLLKNTFAPAPHQHPINDLPSAENLSLSQDGTPLSLSEKTQLVEGILTAMELTERFAPRILLVGHGSRSRNNPHAAGLDCGACGGQTGEINVRVLAGLLNDPDIRHALAERRIVIPDHCRFVPALHNTTTDDIDCLGHTVDDEIGEWLNQASHLCRQQRHALLDSHQDNRPDDLAQSARQRSQDWSQVRPEWGLANNASFIVAPRAWTRSLNLEGRSFLHDYTWQRDAGERLLELIMTAPMIVTHWINMQYNASVTDNLRYGSGNKVLHNVVGGNLGVFEGNGGDLRIGLPWQSLHDGRQWMHQPQRLSVYIAAPKEAIATIIERHKTVADLINNDWLYLFQWNLDTQTIWRYYRTQWRDVEAEPSHDGAP